jgi:hypothetical protein
VPAAHPGVVRAKFEARQLGLLLDGRDGCHQAIDIHPIPHPLFH